MNFFHIEAPLSVISVRMTPECCYHRKAGVEDEVQLRDYSPGVPMVGFCVRNGFELIIRSIIELCDSLRHHGAPTGSSD